MSNVITYNLDPGQHPKGLYLTAIISIINLAIGQITKSDVAWGVGIIAGVLTIINAIYTWKEKVLSIKKLKMDIEEEKLKSHKSKNKKSNYE